MVRDLVARYSLIDALGMCLILYCMNEMMLFVVEVAFIGACLLRLWSHPHMKFFWVVSAAMLLIMKPLPRMYPVMHFFAATIIATVTTGHQKGPTQLLLSQGIVVLFAYTRRATNLLYGDHAPSLAELLDLSIVPRDQWLDKFSYTTRYLVPLAVTVLGIFFLIEAEGRKSRQPWLWKIAAHARVNLFDPLKRRTTGKNQLEYKVRYVQDHLIGLIVNCDAKDLLVTVDAVEWTQLWTKDSLLIIYGLSPRVDYSARIKNVKTESVCELTISTNVPEKAASDTKGVRRQTPMTTLLEAQKIAFATLAEERNKLKKQRKEQNKILASLRHEVDTLPAKYSRSTKSDERLVRKALSLQETVKQIQEDIKEIQDANTDLERSKPDLDALHSQHKVQVNDKLRSLEDQLARLNSKTAEIATARETQTQEVTRLNQRKVRIKEKLARVKDDVATVRKSTDQVLSSAIEKHKGASSQKTQRRLAQTAEFETSIHKLEQGYHDVITRTRLLEESRATSW